MLRWVNPILRGSFVDLGDLCVSKIPPMPHRLIHEVVLRSEGEDAPHHPRTMILERSIAPSLEDFFSEIGCYETI